MSKKLSGSSAEKNSIAQLIYPLLKRYCKTIASSPWEAEDLAHDTFIRWFKSASQEHYQSIPKSLLFKMASHTWIDQYRKQKIMESPLDEFIHSEYSEVDRFDIEHTIHMLVSTLTVQQSIILFLHDVFAYKAQEISVLLNSSEGAIKAALHRARKALKKQKNEHPKEIDHDRLSAEQEETIQVMVECVTTHTPSHLIEVIPSIIQGGTKQLPDIECCLAA